MLRQATELNGYRLGARDGEIGHVREFYFEDVNWTVRYLVADTGNWLTGRLVLISPYALDPVHKADKIIPVELTKKQIENAPPLDSEKPVSRQYELEYYSFYGWPAYWDGSEAWGSVNRPDRASGSWSEASRKHTDDPHLRSTKDAIGHSIQALDGEIGHIEDVVVDGGQKQSVFEPGREPLDGAGDLRVDRVALATRGCGVMRLVEDEQGAGAECPEPVAKGSRVGLVDQQTMGNQKAGMRGPGVDPEASFAANPGDEIFVEDLEGEAETLLEFLLPLEQHRRGQATTISRTFLRISNSRAIKPASMVLPRPTSSAMKRFTRGRRSAFRSGSS